MRGTAEVGWYAAWFVALVGLVLICVAIFGDYSAVAWDLRTTVRLSTALQGVGIIAGAIMMMVISSICSGVADLIDLATGERKAREHREFEEREAVRKAALVSRQIAPAPPSS